MAEMAVMPFVPSSGDQQPFHHSQSHVGDLHEEDSECPHIDDEDEGLLALGKRLDPNASQLQKKEFKRSWREEWKVRHKWVYPIRKEGGELRLKCHWCTIFNMDNVFAKEGCSTMQLSALNTHAKSEAHKTAETRWVGCDMTLTTLDVPDSLWDLGGKQSGNGHDAADAEFGEMANDTEPNVRSVGRKRKALSLSKGETLGSIMQNNNTKIIEVLLDAEKGRNRRHATDVALAKRHFQLEEQKLHIEEQRLEFEKMRFEGTMALGQGYITALTNIGNGLMKIGNAMEAAKRS
ncbi:hypothetical protein O6H91_09G009000 [Diphasiastrum complanatum]|uniref:Uncharacterized protein n=2 Tax=Diphasiastrum complanatum TaxID=34168 RepID=A0ACC2CL39_DIPCM|nr:hypothetical protein O6H91_09G009000 [Diphasiastrum complanatum]KAJ7542732.1 hypothetical protein O6H91_09G009000 [Diphasiastrum complanatum]